jgi:hypothetical protein
VAGATVPGDRTLLESRHIDLSQFLAGGQVADLEAEPVVDADVTARGGTIGREGASGDRPGTFVSRRG